MASITKRPDGQWRARYRDVHGREHAKHFARKIDGQRWLDEITASTVTGQYVDPKAGRVTFDAYFTRWAGRQVWAPMTEVQNDLVRRSVPFGTVRMADLRRSHLEEWVKAMSATGYAATTITTRVNVVRAALKAAVSDRVISSDPSPGLRLPRRRRAEASMSLPSAEAIAALLAATDDRMRAYIALCAFAGLRLGEASGLKLSDVNFLGRTLRVERQVQRRRGGSAEIRPPKYGSERTVFLPDELLQMLTGHVQGHGTLPDGWLFPTADGRPIPPTTVNAWWHRTLKTAGVEGVHIHGLRHFYASGLIAAGCDVVTVQRALGHKSASVTLNTYAHLWPSAEDRTRAAASGLAASVLATRADSTRTGASS
ncbi:tyrosine-type recombinase/integrase [Terrabacter sp. 2RAF25]|uniref:tyrosine-type recombinase/integrase n=1 Tax=Terrabacter sp. 2RAF25 TaxID=3232998 RepID=UPI003F9BB55B